MKPSTRRRFFQISCSVSILGLAGCPSLTNSNPPPNQSREYDQLENTKIYVADDVGLRLPEGATRVDEPENARLIVLHGNLAETPEQVTTWLTEDCIIALLGDQAQESWLDVVQSEPYHEAFDSEGHSVGEPAPHLLIAVAIEDRTTTYRKSWGDQPANDELLAAFDETMADIRTRKSEEQK